MASDTLNIKTADGKSFDAYISRPKAASAPAVLVIQEIFGVNAWVRKVSDWLADEGYLAIAPDLFHRIQPNIQLTDQTEAEWGRAFELFQQFDQDKGVNDLIDTMNTVRALKECTGKVGTIGFCLGGKLAYSMATRSDAEANVGYYGVGIENSLNETVQKALCLHIAELDEYCKPEAQAKIKEALENNPKVQLYFYNADHAFARVGGKHYDEKLAKQAHERSLQFFAQHLK